jgi:ankyrin repeat protein
VAKLEARASQLPSSTAFLFACENGSVECAEALVAAGCDTAATNDNGSTGLMCAASAGQTAVVERLLALGLADLEAVSKIRSTAFLCACGTGSVGCVEVLVAFGCDTAATSETGATGLMYAADNGHVAVVERLLAMGLAELEAVNINGNTAFLCACWSGRVGCVEALVAAGCDSMAADNCGGTGIMHAADMGHTAVVERLIAMPGVVGRGHVSLLTILDT